MATLPAGPSFHRMPEARFTVTYDGPDVEGGYMDAAILGGAMVSMGKLVEHSIELLASYQVPVTVEVAADFRSGSFSYDILTSIPDSLETLKGLTSADAIHIAMDAIGISGGGLIGLLVWLRRRKVKEIGPVSDSQTATVTTEDGDTTVVKADVVNLFQNSTIRIDMSGVVAPLEREGIKEFRTGTGRVASTTITQDQLEYFDPPAPVGEILQDRETEEFVQITGVSFIPGRKWQLRLPDGTTFNSHLDPAYTQRVVPGGERFGAGDLFRVLLHTVVTREVDGRLRAEREVVKVLAHLPAPTQLRLDFPKP